MQTALHFIVKLLIAISLYIFLLLPGSSAEELEYGESGEENYKTYLTQTLPKNLLLGASNTFRGWNLAILGTATGASLLLSQTDADREIQDSLNNSLGKFGDIGDIGGNALTLAGINTALFLIGSSSGDEKLIETAKALFEANILTAFSTSVLKLTVGRERPDGSGTRFTSSFPSGHTSGSFALAATVDSMYGHKIGIPLYAFAGFVGLSRISDNKHFLSDVLFGAVLGTAIGRGVAKVHKNKKGNRFTVLPFTDGQSSGLMFTISW